MPTCLADAPLPFEASVISQVVERFGSIDQIDHYATLRQAEFEGLVIFGGVLNQDTGAALPTDVRPHLTALGIRCVDRVEDLGSTLSGPAGRPLPLRLEPVGG